MLKRYTKGGDRYKYAFVKKTISFKNRQNRGAYDNNYVYDSLFGFFDHIVYTNKTHVNLTSQT
jgi:hypothetical protein